MTHGGLLASGVGIALAALLLTGCTAATPAPNDSASPSVPPASSSPSSTPTPTATAVADPQVRVPVSCGDLLSTADVSKLVDGVPVTVLTDETTNPTNEQAIANLQRGILSCVWVGPSHTIDGPDQDVALYVQPAGKVDFAKNFDYLKSGWKTPVINTFGDKSEYGCFVGGGYYCSANVLVGDYWLTADAHNANKATKVSLATARQRIQTVLNAVVPALKNAGAAGPAWVPPKEAGSGFCDSKSSTGVMRRAFALSDLVRDGEPADGGYDVSTIATTDTAVCAWAPGASSTKVGASMIFVTMVPGGAWAIPHLVADRPSRPDYGRYSVVSVPGTSGALLACGNKYCYGIVGVGANVFAVSFANVGSARSLKSFTAFAKALTTI